MVNFPKSKILVCTSIGWQTSVLWTPLSRSKYAAKMTCLVKDQLPLVFVHLSVVRLVKRLHPYSNADKFHLRHFDPLMLDFYGFYAFNCRISLRSPTLSFVSDVKSWADNMFRNGGYHVTDRVKCADKWWQPSNLYIVQAKAFIETLSFIYFSSLSETNFFLNIVTLFVFWRLSRSFPPLAEHMFPRNGFGNNWSAASLLCKLPSVGNSMKGQRFNLGNAKSFQWQCYTPSHLVARDKDRYTNGRANSSLLVKWVAWWGLQVKVAAWTFPAVSRSSRAHFLRNCAFKVLRGT